MADYFWWPLSPDTTDEEAIEQFRRKFGREPTTPPFRDKIAVYVGPVTPEEEMRWRKGEYKSI